jgi:amidase
MNVVDLAFTPALDQARLVRAGEVSPLELTELYLYRIEQFNPLLGCYFHVMAEQAIADAKAKTEYLAQHPDTLPPFFGVPISIQRSQPRGGGALQLWHSGSP